MSSTKRIIVLGGGISGLMAAQAIQDRGHECMLLEQCPSLGGLTRTIEVGDFCFDYTGHFLHLSRYPTPADIPYAGLCNENWQRVARRSCCFVAGRFITAPIQYNLGQLPPGILDECVKSYEARPRPETAEAVSFRDYIVQGFGQYLADLFLIPQNEKTMAISLDRLSKRAVRRFFPPPNEALVRAGIRCDPQPPGEYNSSFWYPKTGGIGALVKGLASQLKNAWTNQRVVAVDLGNRTLQTSAGVSFGWDYLFSSTPLKSLCQMVNDFELRAAGEDLSHSSTIAFNIGFEGPVRPEFRDIHWIYVPDRSIPFYRIGFYSNISHKTCSDGCSAVYVEVGVPGGAAQKIDIANDLQPRVLASLDQLGWIESRKVACVVFHVLENAYVHLTDKREGLMERTLARLRQCGIYPIGRYGLWDYTGMEDSMLSAQITVREALDGI